MSKLAMSYDDFKATCQANGRRVRYTEVGKHGWRSVEDILDGKPAKPGPHWVDASPIPCTQRLIGKYDFISGTGEFFQ